MLMPMDGSVLAQQVLESWEIQARLNHFLLSAISPDGWEAKPVKGKSPQGHFAHIHNVRLIWIKSVDSDLMEGLLKLESPSIEEASQALEASDTAMREMISRGLQQGRIKGFKPHPVAFLGYITSHEAYHRAQAELALRQSGHPLDDKTAYGLWEWGVR